MSARLPGELVRLTYDTPNLVRDGDYVRTRTGRTYLVDSARLIRQRYPGRHHRWALTAVVMDANHDVEPDAVVHEFIWWKR